MRRPLSTLRLPFPATAAGAALLAALTLGACAVNMGAPKEIPLATVALRADEGAAPAEAAAAIREGGARTALLVSTGDEAWFGAVAEAAGLHLSGPARTDDGLGLAFLGLEPLGDTAIDLRYDGRTFTVQDALYDLDDRRFLDLLAFEVGDAADARPLIAALLSYVATDVDATAAVVMAVAVPSPAVGDSVARMLSPGFEDALRCRAGGTSPAGSNGAGTAGAGADAELRDGVRLFYGPEARIFCRSAEAGDVPAGDRVRASLVMGRR